MYPEIKETSKAPSKVELFLHTAFDSNLKVNSVLFQGFQGRDSEIRAGFLRDFLSGGKCTENG